MPGGFTCCVPGCFNNNKKERHLKYYVFPKDPQERKIWTRLISRKGGKGKFTLFTPTTGHRVCSEHFEGGQKTYMIKRPTVFPLKKQPVHTSKRRTIVKIDAKKNEEVEPTSAQDVQPVEHVGLTTEQKGQSQVDATSVPGTELLDHSYTIQGDTENLRKVIMEKNKIIDEMMDDLRCLESQLEEAKEKLRISQAELSLSKQENLRLTRKYHTVNLQLARTKRQMMSKMHCIDALRDNPAALNFYTGFASYSEFRILYDFLSPDIIYLHYWGSQQKHQEEPTRGKTRTLSAEDELLMTLTRLRAGLLVEDLAYRFGVHHTTVSRICRTYVDLLSRRFRQIPIWPTRDVIDKHMPQCFLDSYKSTRVILDCTEIHIENPSHFSVQSETFSNYKGHNTAKGLLGISPNGFVTFVSDLVPGRMSDKEVTENSGLIDLLEEGDSVMADRGFLIDEYLAQKRIQLNMPPFMGGKPQLSPNEEQQTRQIASVRIHVERAIERVKNFRILKYVFPNSMATELNKIWIICCYLVNFTTKPIADDK